jgi:hypothetical protein
VDARHRGRPESIATFRRWSETGVVPRVRVDVMVLFVLVTLVLALAPGHGALGWVLALVGAVSVGVVVGRSAAAIRESTGRDVAGADECRLVIRG